MSAKQAVHGCAGVAKGWGWTHRCPSQARSGLGLPYKRPRACHLPPAMLVHRASSRQSLLGKAETDTPQRNTFLVYLVYRKIPKHGAYAPQHILPCSAIVRATAAACTATTTLVCRRPNHRTTARHSPNRTDQRRPPFCNRPGKAEILLLMAAVPCPCGDKGCCLL